MVLSKWRAAAGTVAVTLGLGGWAWAQPGASAQPVAPVGAPPAAITVQPVPDLPQLVVPMRPRAGAEDPVRVMSVSSVVEVNGTVATTRVSVTLRNGSDRARETQVILPVPAEAVLRQYELPGLGSEAGIAKVYRREEARAIYRDIVRRTIDPGLLEFAGYGLVQSSVFPVPAGGTQEFVVTYEEVLGRDGRRVEVELPRSASLAGAVGVEWSIELRTRGYADIWSPTHEIVTQVTENAGDPRRTARVMNPQEPGPVKFSLISTAEGPTLELFAYPDASVGGGSGEGGYVTLVLTGLDRVKATGDAAARAKREVTLVIDRSGSMQGAKIEQAKAAALQVLGALDDGERFNIIDYSDSVQAFSEAGVEKSAQTLEAARAYIAAIAAVGGTNIHDALVEALRPEPAPGFLPIVLFLTDGLPTVGRTGEAEIRGAARAANAGTTTRRVFTFGVGDDVNAALLNAVATDTRARATFVKPGEDVEAAVGKVYEGLKGPVLIEPRLVVTGISGQHGARVEDRFEPARVVRDMQPARLPDVYQGDRLVLAGKYTTGDRIRLTVIGGDGVGGTRSFAVELDPAKATVRHSFAPRLWAQRQIAAMVEEIRQKGAEPGYSSANDPRFKELVDEIVRLSQQFGVLSEYTAFLAVEPGMMPGHIMGLPSQDGAMRLGLAPEPSAAPAALAARNLDERAVRARIGTAAVEQQAADNRDAFSDNLASNLAFFDLGLRGPDAASLTDELRRRGLDASVGLQNRGDRTLLNINSQWVDGELVNRMQTRAATARREIEALPTDLADEARAERLEAINAAVMAELKPDRTIEFGTDAYFELLDALVAQNRQGLLGLTGELLLWHEGQRVLVRNVIN